MSAFLSLFKFVVIIFILYLFAIFFICRVKKCNAQTAMRYFWDFVLNCFDINTEKSSIVDVFPVYIGIDEMYYPHADIIEKDFDSLAKDFQVFYFYNFKFCGNCLLYQFKAELPSKQMSDYELIEYTQKKCDVIVHHYMHSMNPQLGHINSLVATNYIDGILSVSVAENANGAKENAEYSNNISKYYRSRNTVVKKELEEKWDDSDDEMGL